MRLSRANIVLAVVAAALALLSVALERPQLATLAEGPLFPAFRPARAARVRIESPGGSVELARRGDGWGVVQRQYFPALDFAVEELLGRIASLSGAARVSDRADAHERFGVDVAGTRVVATAADGALLAAFVHGTAQAGAEGLPTAARATYVRPAEGDAVYRSPGFPAVESDPSGWIASRLLDFELRQVEALEARFGDVQLALELGPDGAWHGPLGELVPQAPVQRVLEAAAGLYAADLAPPGTSARFEPAVSVSLRLVDGGAPRIEIGPDVTGATGEAGEASGRQLARSPDWEQDWVVELPADSAGALTAALEALAGAGNTR